MGNADIIIKDFADLVSVINSSGHCNQEIKRRLCLGRTAMDKLGKIIKEKDVPWKTNP